MEKTKIPKLSIKDFVKDSSSQRLTSIKLPRDLSLGGTKQHKKLYKPNLNVIRNKTAIENKLHDINKTRLKTRRGKEPVKQRYVQSSGIFSEGIISDIVPAVRLKQEALPKNASTITNTVELTESFKKREQNVVKDIKQFLEGSDSDSEDSSSVKYINWNEALFKTFKTEVKPGISSIKDHFFGIDDQKPTLNLWQLPETFNFKRETQPGDFSLSDMAEGTIGKIRIRKSGKADVLIGNLSYELEAADWEPFNEHLTSVCMGDISRAAILGSLQNRFILSPNWERLLKD